MNKGRLLMVVVTIAAFAGVLNAYRPTRGVPLEVKGEQISANELVFTPTPTLTLPSVKIGDETYSYLVIKSIQPGQLKLVPNYENQASTEEMLEVKKCSQVVNGGFYGTDLKPLGWAVENGKEISRTKSSQLFNGFISIDNNYSMRITSKKPDSEVLYGLQTGPMLIQSSKTLKLSMARDKYARRMVMAVDDDGAIDFLTFYTEGNVMFGPKLADLPKLVEQVAKLENLDLQSAVNLDGGNASVFISSDHKLSELSPVGSWWCIY